MNTTDAIAFLLKKGIRIDPINKKEFRVWDINGNVWMNYHSKGWYYLDSTKDIWTGRQVIKLARSYTDSNQQTSMHKNVKKFSNDKDRTATRDAIKNEDFDKIPSKKRTKSDDIWSWS
jgi:hypothetical protein